MRRRRAVIGIVEARCPVNAAGHQCATLGWVEGFRKLGWDVWIVEDIGRTECVDDAGTVCAPDLSVNVRAWQQFVRAFRFEGRESLFIDGEHPKLEDFRDFARGADLFLNYSGQFHRLELMSEIRTRAYLDVDPGYTQTWATAYDCDMNFEGHDFFISVGIAMGTASCRAPSCGREWIPTLPPASISLFSPKPRSTSGAAWTTVAHWYAGSEVVFNGLLLKPKRESFCEMDALPGMIASPVVVACDLQPQWEDYRTFGEKGWQFRDVSEVCGSVSKYQAFIHGSAGEIGVAKAGYIAAHTGWMSDRSMAYLASGRPVIAMDTGWRELVGEFPGLRAFSDTNEAAKAIAEIEADYETARHSAREVAETVFAQQLIVRRLLDRMEI